jgi:ERCC4-type nuclease
MMLVDPRRGSGELAKPLGRAGVPVKCKAYLPYGDFSFSIDGPHGTCPVLVERKTISEIVGSITDTRFTSKQLPGMVKATSAAGGYSFLVVEGIYRPDPKTGVLQVWGWDYHGRRNGWVDIGHGRTRHLYSTMMAFLTTIRLKGAIIVQPTSTIQETVQWLAMLYRWGQKRWSDHQSIYAVEEARPDSAILGAHTVVRRTAAQLDGVGWVHSRKAESYFPTVLAMAQGTARQWRECLGISRGTATSRKLVRQCQHDLRNERRRR